MRSRRLRSAASWWYQLQGTFNDRERYEDVNVVDIDMECPDQFDRLGNRRVNLAYVSIGEAEDYRDYWADMPKNLIIAENPDWPENYAVRFWRDNWHTIVKGMIVKAKKKGFDGVYLDKCDVVWDISPNVLSEDSLTARMIDLIEFVREVAGDNMLVVMQNAESLLENQQVIEAIDGLGIEDLFYGSDETGEPNNDTEIARRLELIHASKLPVMCVEYLDDAADIVVAKHLMKSEGFTPLIRPANRELSV